MRRKSILCSNRRFPVRIYYLLLMSAVVNSIGEARNVEKPWGCFSSMLTGAAVQNPHLKGGLVRTAWAKLEPEPGRFDFSEIERQLSLLPSDRSWSLAVYAGWTSINPDADAESPRKTGNLPLLRRQMDAHTPPWMVSELKIETFTCKFRGHDTEMPKCWDPIVQERLGILMQKLAEAYNDDTRLKLVYVPQMTSNGIEGHFNGVPYPTLLAAAGLESGEENAFESIWTDAALTVIRSTAHAFDSKAIAFEVHEMLGTEAIPKQIMNCIINDPILKDQVGIGMWWISGRTDYQSDLIRAIEDYPGDVYGQVIGRSDQSHRFPGGNYSAVFEQAKQLGMRYIEPWNYEFEKHTHDDLLKAFNDYCAEQYSVEK